MMQPPRPAAWIAALLLVASLGFMPREGAAWDKQITPVIDPTNEGDPDTPDGHGVIQLENFGINIQFVRGHFVISLSPSLLRKLADRKGAGLVHRTAEKLSK